MTETTRRFSLWWRYIVMDRRPRPRTVEGRVARCVYFTTGMILFAVTAAALVSLLTGRDGRWFLQEKGDVLGLCWIELAILLGASLIGGHDADLAELELIAMKNEETKCRQDMSS